MSLIQGAGAVIAEIPVAEHYGHDRAVARHPVAAVGAIRQHLLEFPEFAIAGINQKRQLVIAWVLVIVISEPKHFYSH